MLTPTIKPIKVNPRKQIHSYALTPQITRRESVNPPRPSIGSPEDAMSPPSDRYKESTRLEQSESIDVSPKEICLSPDDGPVMRRRKNKRRSINRSSSSQSSQNEDSDGDQPSGKTIHLSDVRQSSQLEMSTPRQDRSLKVLAQKSKLDTENVVGQSVFMQCFFFLIMVTFTVVYPSINLILRSQETRISASEQLTMNIASLKEQLPQQNPHFWKHIQKDIEYRLKEDPLSPAVILLIANTLNPDAIKTLSCIANQVARISSMILKGRGPDGDIYSDALVVKVELFPEGDSHTVRSWLHDRLDNKLSEYGAVVLPFINSVAGQVVHTLHGFADDTNAPHKRAVIILTMNTTMDIEDKGLCSDKLALSIIDQSWSDLMEKDKSSLSSRIMVNPLAVSPVRNVDQLPICAPL